MAVLPLWPCHCFPSPCDGAIISWSILIGIFRSLACLNAFFSHFPTQYQPGNSTASFSRYVLLIIPPPPPMLHLSFLPCVVLYIACFQPPLSFFLSLAHGSTLSILDLLWEPFTGYLSMNGRLSRNGYLAATSLLLLVVTSC